ncbi:MAG: dihydrolipoyl dehydrogenase [Chloroflexi bacterium]|nr:MAG: dihydrolipoyl dehydrogenase [Chloroflexota bacterium]
MVVGDIPVRVDVAVLGAGPGGYAAAIRAAQLGKDVVIIDPNPPGGVCLRQGCIPAKSLLAASHRFRQAAESAHMGISAAPQLDWPQMQRWKDGIVTRLSGGVRRLLKDNGVEWVAGRGKFVSTTELHVETDHSAEHYIFEQAIIATGADPAELPGLPFDGVRVLTPAQALQITELPASVAVAGSGYIAAELAALFANLGCGVRLLIPAGEDFLPEFDPAAGRRLLVALKKQGVAVQKNVADLSAAAGDADLVAACGAALPRSGRLQLARAGVQPDARGAIPVNAQMQTTNPAIFAVGDVTGGSPLAHVALKQGKVAAETLAGLPAAFEPQAVPRVVWTEPQVAAVGLTAAQAEAAGYRVQRGRFPLAANGRALTLDAGDGFAQVVAEAGTEILLGATIVGPQAESLIGEAALALEMGATLTDLAETLHPHPSPAEALQEAAEAALGIAIHIQ